MALIDYQALVDSLVRDDAEKITPADRDKAIGLAVVQYSKDRPKDKSEDVIAAGGHYLPLPVNWETDFSSLKAVEFPTDEVPPNYFESGVYSMYNHPTGLKIQSKHYFTANDTARLHFTIKHTLTKTTDNIPEDDELAVASWAAAVLCDQLASFYSGSSDSTIAADTVEHASKAKDFAIRANSLRKRYHDHLGIDPKRNTAAGVVVDLDMKNSRGRDRLQHPGRFR